MRLNPQIFMMIVGAAALVVGAILFIPYPLGSCQSPTSIGAVEVCFTSPGSVVSLVGMALLVIGFLGQQILPIILRKKRD